MLAPAHADDFLFGPVSMSNELPYFPFYPADFLLDEKVEAMTPAQVGCYMLLLCRSWISSEPGYIPSDEVKLARLARVDRHDWELVKPNVLACFKTDPTGRMYQPRLLAEYQKALEAHEARVKGGKVKSARARMKSSNDPANLQHEPSTCSAHAQHEVSTSLPRGNRTEQNRTEQNKKDIAPVKTVAAAESPLFASDTSGGPDTLPDQTPGLSGQADGQKTKTADKPPRKPNPAWDAVCEVWGLKPDTKADATRIGKLARDYSAKGATLEEIRTRLDRCKRAWPNVTVVTPEALLKHWETFANEPERKHDNISRVDSDRPTKARVYVESPGFDPTAISPNGGPKQVVDENGRVYEEDPFGLHPRS